MSRMKKKCTYHQYDFEDVYGKEWKVSPLPVSRDGQLNIEDCYDRSVLGEESEAERVDRRMKALASCRIMLQRIISGDYVESNIYPVYLNRKDVPRAEKYRTSRETQKRLNQKNRQKKYIRIINTNFRAGDLLSKKAGDDAVEIYICDRVCGWTHQQGADPSPSDHVCHGQRCGGKQMDKRQSRE